MSEKKSIDKRPIRDLLQEKDAFLTTSEKAYEYFLRHTKVFIAAAAVLGICVIAAAVYTRHQKSAEAESVLAFEKAFDLAASQPDDQTSGLTALEKVRADYGQRQGARLAAFALVNFYAARQETDKALPLAENLLQTLRPAETSLKPLLLNNMGGLYESAGDFLRAAKSYDAVLALDHLSPALRLETLMALGRVEAAAGRNAEAIARYQEVVNEFPQSFKAYLANVKMAELKGEPLAFPLPPAAGMAELKLNPESESPSLSEPSTDAPGASGDDRTAPDDGPNAEAAGGQADSPGNAPVGE